MEHERMPGGFTPERLTSLHESVMEEIRALHWATPARGLTMPQFRVLCIVSRHGRITPGELAAILDVTAPTITDIVNRMTASGLLSREKCDRDRRLVYLSPTPKGEALLREFFAQWSHTHLSLFRSLDEEQRNTVGRGLEELLAAVRHYRASTRGGPAGGTADRPEDESPQDDGRENGRDHSPNDGPRLGRERLATSEHDQR